MYYSTDIVITGITVQQCSGNEKFTNQITSTTSPVVSYYRINAYICTRPFTTANLYESNIP